VKSFTKLFLQLTPLYFYITLSQTAYAETTVVIEDESSADSATSDVIKTRETGNTPQPPLINTPVKPSYEPENAEAVSEQKTPEPPAKTEHEEATDIDVDTDVTAVDVEHGEKPTQKKWAETYPVSVNADWLQLKSGEWLRGRITILQKDSLEFDSDELDDLIIEWKNVKYLKSYEPYKLRFDSQGRTPITGVIEVINDIVKVTTDYDEKIFKRSDLLTIASGKETEISYWKSKITFSLNLREGNTKQTDFTSKINAKRRTTDSKLVLDYLGNFTEVEQTQTINNHRLNATYNFYLTRNFFLTPFFSEFYRDPFQNIDQRIKLGIGAGYSLINNNETEWDITGGPAYQETRFESVQVGKNQTDGTFTLTLGSNFETELNDRVDLQGSYSMALGDKEIGNYTHHALFTVGTELTDKLDLDVTAIWDYVRKPVADINGNTPEKDDFRVMIGLGYDL